MNVHLRREEQGRHMPPFWKITAPYASVKFRKQVVSDGGYLICHINGNGYVSIDEIRYNANTYLKLEAGTHMVEVHVSNLGGLPAIYVDSDVCPSDNTWKCNHFAGEFSPVGYDLYFDSVDKSPDIFPFHYKRIHPVRKEKVEAGILFDFGNEFFGYLNINNVDENNALGIFYGESREEALDIEHTYITEYVKGEKEYRLRQRAFRYIYIKGCSDTVEVSADYEYLPLKYKGKFRTKNKLFNDIYDAAAYTFHLNCREVLLDGIKRDRWVWSGDAYQSFRINRYLFADKAVEQRTLIGLIGRLPIEQHINTIIDYSLFWVISLYENYLAYGDKVFLERIYPMAEELMKFCETRLNEDGFIEGIADDWTFIDWSEFDICGAFCAEQMLLIQAYATMSYISKELGNSRAAEFLKKSEELKNRVNEYYWNTEKGAYIDSYKSGNANVTRHANIFAVMYDIASEEQAQSILNNVLRNDAVIKIKTPYFVGYELDVLAKLGEFRLLEEQIESYYGGMIKEGAQTIWEEYNPQLKGVEHYAMYGRRYEKSLCHAWGASPIYLFGRYYLGVHSNSAGYKTFTVEPMLGGFTEFSGTVPINDGLVTVDLCESKLSVTATKEGGTLLWEGKSYALIPNETCVINF